MIKMISFPSSNDPSTADHAAMGTAYMILYALGPLWKYMKNNPWCHEKSASTTQVLSTSLKVCTVKTCRAWKICPGQSISTGTPYYTARNPSSPSPALHRFCSLSHSTPHLWSIMIRRPQLVNIVHTAHVSLLAHYASMGKARRASTTTQPCGSCTKLSTTKKETSFPLDPPSPVRQPEITVCHETATQGFVCESLLYLENTEAALIVESTSTNPTRLGGIGHCRVTFSEPQASGKMAFVHVDSVFTNLKCLGHTDEWQQSL